MAGLLKKVRVEVMVCLNDGRKRGDQCRTNSALFVLHCINVVDLNGHGFPCAVCQLTSANTCFANLARLVSLVNEVTLQLLTGFNFKVYGTITFTSL